MFLLISLFSLNCFCALRMLAAQTSHENSVWFAVKQIRESMDKCRGKRRYHVVGKPRVTLRNRKITQYILNNNIGYFYFFLAS